MTRDEARKIIADWIMNDSDQFDLDDFGYAAADDLLSKLPLSDFPPTGEGLTECGESVGRERTEEIPPLIAYVSDHVFDGVRPLSKARVEKLKDNFERTHGEAAPVPNGTRGGAAK